MRSGRVWTAIDKIAEAYLDDSAELNPVAATGLGMPGHDDRLPALDPAWHDEGSRRMSEGTLRYELDRYLGWPGQAPSYKVGERHWLELREQARAADGAAFDLRAFHRRALDIGSVGLDVLHDALRGLDPDQEDR